MYYLFDNFLIYESYITINCILFPKRNNYFGMVENLKDFKIVQHLHNNYFCKSNIFDNLLHRKYLKK